jgi:hypothetical protein
VTPRISPALWRCLPILLGLILSCRAPAVSAAGKPPRGTKPARAAAGVRAVRTAPQAVPAPIYGLTLDSMEDLPAILAALRGFSRKVTVRIVFDRGMDPADYREAVDQIHQVAYILGQPADSSYVKHYTLAQYRARFAAYLRAFGDRVELWEIGNEVNGNWLGPRPEVAAKVAAAYDVVRAAGGKTVLTLLYNEGQGCARAPDCAEAPHYEMYAWVGKHIPEKLRRGVDYLLLSYYPEHSPGFSPDWEREFARLGRIFPNAKLGFGELGLEEGAETEKAALIREFYSLRIGHPRYIGGIFWWYGKQDLVPRSKPLWRVLDDTIQK